MIFTSKPGSAERPLLLTKRWTHHTTSGGYDRLAHGANTVVVQRRPVSAFTHRLARFWWNRTRGCPEYLLDYRYEDWIAEWTVVLKIATRQADVVHVLYGDEQLDLLLRRRSLLRCPLVATFHLPTFRVKERFERLQKNLLAGLDAAIVVSRCQLDEYRRWLGYDRVVFVPHGIDTQEFVPASSFPTCRRLRLIMVGDHMRDWASLHRIIDACNAQRLPVQFDVVAPAYNHSWLAGCDNTLAVTGISEQRLIDMYQAADALLIPVTYATACNAVLEALACGVPVITYAVGGMPDYVDERCGWLYPPGEVAGVVDLIKRLCEDRRHAHDKRTAARARALELDWTRVSQQTRAIFEALASGRSAAAEHSGVQDRA